MAQHHSDAQASNASRFAWLGQHGRTFAMALLMLVMVGAGMGLERFVVDDSVIGSQRSEQLADLPEFETLEEVYAYIREYYVLSDDISDEELIWGAASGMMEALGDEGHSYFLNPTEAEENRESQSGAFVGIGVRIDTEVAPPQIILPMQDSPAFEAGILQNDVILSIDGVSYEDYTDMREFADLIGGDEGTDVDIELRHEGDVESYTVTITRASVKINTVSWAMLPDNVLWVRISQFDDGTNRDFERALRRGKRAGAESLVLDLRANPGGLVTEQLAVLGQFLPAETVTAQELDAEGNVEYRVTDAEEGEWRDQPVVVLIDENSASSSEMVASAIMDNDRGITVGQRTVGTGTTIFPIDLNDGSMMYIGFIMTLTANGTTIWHVGLEPNITIANEPGVSMALPYMFPEAALDEDTLLATNDDQLLVAVDEATGGQ